MTQKMRELKLRRGYTDVILQMRIFNVRTDSIGYDLLQIAIMSYLSNPSLQIEDLVKIAFENSPMPLREEDECFEKLEEALQNVKARRFKQLMDSDTLVFEFIRNVAAEVRMKTLVEIRDSSEELNIDDEVKEVFCKVAIRKMNNPNNGFSEILHYCAGRYNYDNVDDLIIYLYKVVKNNDFEEQLTTCNINTLWEKKHQLCQSVVGEIEELVEVFIKEHVNIIF